MTSALFSESLTGIVAHLVHLGIAAAAVLVFVAIYVTITPHREFHLIRQGNSAAAIQLTGTFIGFAIPVAVVIGHSVSIPDMLLWGAVAAIVQLAVFVVIARLLFKEISSKITENCAASGQFVGGIGIGVGILQAACMVP
jgi:putative membrane protein